MTTDFPPLFSTLFHWLSLLLWLGCCAVQDLRRRRIDNRLTLGGGALALAYLLMTGRSWLQAPGADAALGVVLALALTLPGYALRRLGGADVKLLVALALASGSSLLLGTFIGAGVSSMLWLLIGPRLWPKLSGGIQTALHLIRPNTSNMYPFAPFILIGFSMSAVILR